MYRLQNLHSHTLYCDGLLSPEDMIIAAINRGCDSFGFSGHSYAPHDTGCSMTPDDTIKYFEEYAQLKSKYAEKIDLFLGIEQDYYTDIVTGLPNSPPDYSIGAVHDLLTGDIFSCIDSSERSQKRVCDEYFNGDYYAMAECYYETMADVINKTGADIVAHFDLIAKYNQGGKFFDETNSRYVASALTAMDEILKNHNLFEVNTGAMYKLGRQEPYPSLLLLKELRIRGGEVILSSDSHDGESIGYKFDDMKELLKHCGFKYVKQLTVNGFIDVLLT